MNLPEEYLHILQADTRIYTLLWNAQYGWNQFGNGNFKPLPKDVLFQRGLEFLLDYVADADYELCQAFLTDINTVPATNEPVTHQVVALHLRALSEPYLYCKIECDIFWENETQKSIFCKIRKLTAEEVYRLQLAQSITNDKNPSFFADGVKGLMLRHPEAKFAVIQFDISKFKMINEQYGDEFGTEILQYIIHSLKILCDSEQLYARLSADLFMVFTKYETKEGLLAFIEKLNEQLSTYKGIRYRLDFGVCYVDNPDTSIRIYGDNATLARKSIKNDALTYVAFYNEELKQDARTRKFVEDRMEGALRKGEFVMYLQPKYSISRNTVVGAEALIRWFSAERGLLQPMEFIPLFEQNNFIIKVDYFIWEEACKAIRNWIDTGIEPVPISVNMSRKHLTNTDFISVLNDLMQKYQIDKKYLEIEITETASGADVIDCVNLLKNNGYTLLMDDFGSGYSSLSTLKDTKFDILKIDRNFLHNFIGSDRGQKIVEYIIKMTTSIGLDLIAEGVENREETVFLSDCGCDKVQGFYYAKPMSLYDFNKMRS